MNPFTNLATSDYSGTEMFPAIVLVTIISLIVIAAWWQTFEKAKQPGWAFLIPIYNIYVMLKIANRPEWWLVLYLIPIVNVFVHAVVAADIASAFKKSNLFGIFWLWLFPTIGAIILGFGDAKYKKPAKKR